MMEYNQTKINQSNPPIAKLILISVIASIGIFLFLVFFLQVFFILVATPLGVLFVGFGAQNVVALIITLIMYKFLSNVLGNSGVQDPGIVAFSFIFTFVISLASVLLDANKTGFAVVDPSLLGFKGIPSVAIIFFLLFVGIFGVLIFSLIRKYTNYRLVVLVIPILLLCYTKFFYVDSNSLKYYDVSKVSSTEIRKGKSLEWYMAPQENPLNLSLLTSVGTPARPCEIQEGSRFVKCDYSRYESDDKPLAELIQTTAKLQGSMERFLYDGKKCGIDGINAVASAKYGMEDKSGLSDRYTPEDCSSFVTPGRTTVYYEVKKVSNATSIKDNLWNLYFTKGDTIVTFQMEDLFGSPSEPDTQALLGKYIDSFQ